MRTADAHPASFLGFASQLLDDVQEASCAPDLALRRGDATSGRVEAIMSCFAAHVAELQNALRRQMMDSAGISSPDAGGARFGGFAGLIAEYASITAKAMVEAERQALVANGRFRRGGDEQSRRATKCKVITGAWLAAGATSRVQACDLLNQHSSRRHAASVMKVAEEQVRDGVARFGREHLFDWIRQENRRFTLAPSFDRYTRAWTLVLLHDFRISASVWERVHESRGATSTEVYLDQLRRRGSLIEWYREAADQIEISGAEADALSPKLAEASFSAALSRAAQKRKSPSRTR